MDLTNSMRSMFVGRQGGSIQPLPSPPLLSEIYLAVPGLHYSSNAWPIRWSTPMRQAVNLSSHVKPPPFIAIPIAGATRSIAICLPPSQQLSRSRPKRRRSFPGIAENLLLLRRRQQRQVPEKEPNFLGRLGAIAINSSAAASHYFSIYERR